MLYGIIAIRQDGRAESLSSAERVFALVFKTPAFRERLKNGGGEAHDCFWNTADDRIIKIEKARREAPE